MKQRMLERLKNIGMITVVILFVALVIAILAFSLLALAASMKAPG